MYNYDINGKSYYSFLKLEASNLFCTLFFPNTDIVIFKTDDVQNNFLSIDFVKKGTIFYSELLIKEYKIDKNIFLNNLISEYDLLKYVEMKKIDSMYVPISASDMFEEIKLLPNICSFSTIDGGEK